MTAHTILIIEDDPSLGEAIQDTIQLAGFKTHLVQSAEQALQECGAYPPSLVVTDVQMQAMDGIAFLKTFKQRYPDVPVILMTAYGTCADAVKAMRLGASDYLLKPFAAESLLQKIERYVMPQLDQSIEPVAVDPASIRLFGIAKRAAQSDAAILISGASGTGKEVLARFVHDHSPRAKAPFVAINCAAIPENMLEATLFGYEKGAYTGAYKAQAGKFEQAQHGTLLLDEISEMDLHLQAKILRVLQERVVERLGGSQSTALDVRIVATTNRELLDEVNAKRFREDLYYRLNVFPLRWSPLCQRQLDIAPLAEYLLAKHVKQTCRSVPMLSDAAIAKLSDYAWPGNVRELENVVQRALILQQDDTIDAEDIQFEWVEMTNVDPVPGEQETLASDLQHKEFELIVKALEVAQGSRKQVAEKLGLSPRTLRYKLAKMRECGIAIPS